MKLHHYILSILIILLVVGGCKKYEEGPLVSFRSPEKRIEGNWRVEKYFVNGIDSTSVVNCQQINLTTQSSTEWEWVWDYELCDCNETNLENKTSTWGFDHAGPSNKKSIFINPIRIDSTNYGIFNDDMYYNYHILKLTNKKMVLLSESYGKNERIELEKRK